MHFFKLSVFIHSVVETVSTFFLFDGPIIVHYIS